MKGIKFKVYLSEEGIIHVFQPPCIVQEHGEEINSRDKLLLANIINFSNPKYVNNWQNDYNRHTNAPFVYKSTSPKYHEL